MRKVLLGLGMVAGIGMAWYVGFNMALSAPVEHGPEATALTDATAETPSIPVAVNKAQPNDLPPLKIKEVVDLSRAYEPVPANQSVLPESLNPVTFIELPPRDKMPYAQTFEEPIEIAPREVK